MLIYNGHVKKYITVILNVSCVHLCGERLIDTELTTLILFSR